MSRVQPRIYAVNVETLRDLARSGANLFLEQIPESRMTLLTETSFDTPIDLRNRFRQKTFQQLVECQNGLGRLLIKLPF